MTNIIEYCQRTQTTSMDIVPLNEVDSLVLSQLAYLNFDSPLALPVSINQLPENFYYSEYTFDKKNNQELLNAVRTSQRFGPIVILNQKNILDYENQEQYSSTTFQLPNGDYFIAWRGTDTTFVGWKEDANISFQPVIPSQETGLTYLETMIRENPGHYYLAGHSKGGTIATYAATFAPREIQDQVRAIYNFDGPSLHPNLVKSEAYQRIAYKIFKFIPTESIYGLIWEESHHYFVIKALGRYLSQHGPYNWVTEDFQFQRQTSNNQFSRSFQQGVLYWLKTTDNTVKETSVNALYRMTEDFHTPFITEALADLPKSMLSISRNAKHFDKDARDLLKMVLNLIIASSLETGKYYIKQSRDYVTPHYLLKRNDRNNNNLQ